MFNWKNYSESYKRSFLIVMAFIFAFGLGYFFRFGQIVVRFYVSEQKEFATYQIGLKDLMDLILIGPIFTILSFFLLKRILDQLEKEEFSKRNEMISYIVFLIAIVVFNYGTMIHVTMNRLNSQIVDDYNTENVYYSVYFLDEYIGHLFQTLGIFMILTEMCILHTINLKHINKETSDEFFMNKYERNWNIFFGLALGVGTALSYLEGQCAFVFLILNPIISAFLIIYSKKKKIPIKENSLLVMFLLMTVFFTITVSIWAVFTGIKPYYPFFYQGSEI